MESISEPFARLEDCAFFFRHMHKQSDAPSITHGVTAAIPASACPFKRPMNCSRTPHGSPRAEILISPSIQRPFRDVRVFMRKCVESRDLDGVMAFVRRNHVSYLGGGGLALVQAADSWKRRIYTGVRSVCPDSLHCARGTAAHRSVLCDFLRCFLPDARDRRANRSGLRPLPL